MPPRPEAVRALLFRELEHSRRRMEKDNAKVPFNVRIPDSRDWFDRLDKLNAEPFPNDRQQPITPAREVF